MPKIAICLRVSAAAVAAIVVAACEGGHETVVVNNSSSPIVVEAALGSGEDPFHPHRYYPVPPGATVLVDTVGHSNPSIDTVTIFDPTCQVVEVVANHAGYQNGATVTIGADGGTTFDVGRRGSIEPSSLRGPDERAGSKSTCEEAAVEL